MLFTGTPSVKGGTGDASEAGSAFSRTFAKIMIAIMRRENFVKNLSLLTGDVRGALDRLVARSGTAGTFDPFDDVYRMVYQLTMRTVGANDIAQSPALLEKTLRLFEEIESARSPARIVFPWLPTPGHIKRMGAGARLYMIFKNIADTRRKTGTRSDDALQFLMDNDYDMLHIISVSPAAPLHSLLRPPPPFYG